MSEKRKDNKGRLLKSGESQRENGGYMYRYTDIHKKRRYVYGKTLNELRKLEDAILQDLHDGIDYAAGEITVIQLVERYLGLRRGLKENTMRAYQTAIARLKQDPFGKMPVNAVKLSDSKGWFIHLYDCGWKHNTIGVAQSVVRPAFEMAVDDDMLRKNPFKFKLADIIPNDAYIRTALTKEQQAHYLHFVGQEEHSPSYEDIVALLETGLRISELYGLTTEDLDLKNRKLHVRRQLCRTASKPYFVTPPKTKSGVRTVPLTEQAITIFQRILHKRGNPKVKFMVNGISGFLFLDRSSMPKVAMHLENHMRILQKNYVSKYGETMPKVTPHVLRHTFCTNMQQSGIDVKSLQYLMGHSNVSVTLDIYTHTDFNRVEDAFRQAVGR